MFYYGTAKTSSVAWKYLAPVKLLQVVCWTRNFTLPRFAARTPPRPFQTHPTPGNQSLVLQVNGTLFLRLVVDSDIPSFQRSGSSFITVLNQHVDIVFVQIRANKCMKTSEKRGGGTRNILHTFLVKIIIRQHLLYLPNLLHPHLLWLWSYRL